MARCSGWLRPLIGADLYHGFSGSTPGGGGGGGGPNGLADVPRPLPCLIQLGSVVSDAAKLGFGSAVRLGKLPADADPPAVYTRKREFII